MYLGTGFHHFWANTISYHHVGRCTFNEMNDLFLTIGIDDFQGHFDMGIPEFQRIHNTVERYLGLKIVNSKGMMGDDWRANDHSCQ